MFEISANDICVEPASVEVEDNTVSAFLQTWFDVDVKFGTHTRDSEDWVDLFVAYDVKTEQLTVKYFVEAQSDEYEYDYTPTENERSAMLSVLADYVKENDGVTLAELVKRYAD